MHFKDTNNSKVKIPKKVYHADTNQKEKARVAILFKNFFWILKHKLGNIYIVQIQKVQKVFSEYQISLSSLFPGHPFPLFRSNHGYTHSVCPSRDILCKCRHFTHFKPWCTWDTVLGAKTPVWALPTMRSRMKDPVSSNFNVEFSCRSGCFNIGQK